MFKKPKIKPGPRTPTTADARQDTTLVQLGGIPRMSGVSTTGTGLTSRARTQKRSLIGGSS